MKLEMRLTPPKLPELKYSHIRRITKMVPQVEQGDINYIIAGGGSVMLLLEAAEVENYELTKQRSKHKRRHKDLELYMFKPVFGDNPHDLLALDEGKLHYLDYTEEPPIGVDLMVEVLNRSYFDFLTPGIDDTTEILTSSGKTFETLRPEFVIASKLFSANGLRQGIDDLDSLALMRRFRLDGDYMDSLIRESEFGKVFEYDEDLVDLVETGKFKNMVSEKIDRIYEGQVPEIRNLTYNEKVSVLRYTPEELSLTDEEKKLISSHQPREDKYGFSDLYRLCMRYMKISSPKNITNFNHLARSDPHIALSAASSLKQTLDMIPNLREDIAEKVLSTPYINVCTSAIRKRISDNPDASYDELVQGF